MGEDGVPVTGKSDRFDSRSDSEKKEWVLRFLSGGCTRYVFGCNQWGLSISENISIDGFIDDVVNFEQYGGYPVLRSGTASKDSMVLSTVVLGRPVTAREFLNRNGFNNLDYFAFLKHSPVRLRGFEYWAGAETSLASNAGKFAWLRSILVDDESIHTFDRIMSFRKSLDLNEMIDFSAREDKQYFESFMRYPPNGVFYDVGAYDGATSLAYVENAGSYGELHLFEPSEANRNLARKKLEGMRDVFIHDPLLGGDCRMTRFVEAGSGSRETVNDGVDVKMVTLDSLSLTPPTFIKVDIEGAELDFLSGARTAISTHRPVIAIACYHAFDHLWQIAEMVLSMNSNYEVYLRQYNEGITETDLFFVPKG